MYAAAPRTSSSTGLASPRLFSRLLAIHPTPTQHTRSTPPHPTPPPHLWLPTCAVGDLTKGAIKGFEGMVQDATGKDDYKFGDVTKNFAKNLFGGLEKGAAAAKKKLDDDAK